MRATRLTVAALGAAVFCSALQAQTATVSRQSFVGTWVGTQRWAIESPPPGANPAQPVSLTIEVVEGRLKGSLTPFMGGEDGLAFSDATIVGEELRAAGAFGEPNPNHVPVTEDVESQGGFKVVPSNGRSRKQPWKDTIKVDLALRSEGVTMKGTATVTMNGMKWLSFAYDLSKKRARY